MPTANEDRSTNLMFLMTLAPLAVGCTGGDTTTSSTFNPVPGGMTAAAMTTTGMGTGGGPAGDPSPDPTTEGHSGAATVGTPPPADSTGDSPPPEDTVGGETDGLDCEPIPVDGEIEPSCIAYGELLSECYYGGDWPQECIDAYASYCQQFLGESDMACAAALIDYNVCLSQLTCEQLMGKEPQCEAQATAFEAACPLR
ncbi:MAG: hypothetical protein K0V04_36155 [Deltaproteobacteria bacterium]|nr:hypothetical protein [Deltaproteobacteria bacterium]